jgi:hypothetical protein
MLTPEREACVMGPTGCVALVSDRPEDWCRVCVRVEIDRLRAELVTIKEQWEYVEPVVANELTRLRAELQDAEHALGDERNLHELQKSVVARLRVDLNQAITVATEHAGEVVRLRAVVKEDRVVEISLRAEVERLTQASEKYRLGMNAQMGLREETQAAADRLAKALRERLPHDHGGHIHADNFCGSNCPQYVLRQHEERVK